MAALTSHWRRTIPLLVLLAGLISFFALGGGEWASIEGLRLRHADLSDWTAANPALSRALFVAIVALMLAVGFPSVAIPMFAGGVMFGWWWGAGLALVATTIGSVVFFLASRHASAAAADTRVGALMARLAEGVKAHAFFYLMFLRFIPVVPTVVATLAAAAARAPLVPFFWATLLGLAPASLIYSGIGAGAGEALDAGAEISLAGAMLRPHILGPLLALGALSLVAILVRARIAR